MNFDYTWVIMDYSKRYLNVNYLYLYWLQEWIKGVSMIRSFNWHALGINICCQECITDTCSVIGCSAHASRQNLNRNHKPSQPNTFKILPNIWYSSTRTFGIVVKLNGRNCYYELWLWELNGRNCDYDDYFYVYSEEFWIY